MTANKAAAIAVHAELAKIWLSIVIDLKFVLEGEEKRRMKAISAQASLLIATCLPRSRKSQKPHESHPADPDGRTSALLIKEIQKLFPEHANHVENFP